MLHQGAPKKALRSRAFVELTTERNLETASGDGCGSGDMLVIGTSGDCSLGCCGGGGVEGDRRLCVS